MIVFTVNEHENICIAGLNRRAGYATDCLYILFRERWPNDHNMNLIKFTIL